MPPRKTKKLSRSEELKKVEEEVLATKERLDELQQLKEDILREVREEEMQALSIYMIKNDIAPADVLSILKTKAVAAVATDKAEEV